MPTKKERTTGGHPPRRRETCSDQPPCGAEGPPRGRPLDPGLQRSADPAVARVPGLYSHGLIPLPVLREIVVPCSEVQRLVIRWQLPQPLLGVGDAACEVGRNPSVAAILVLALVLTLLIGADGADLHPVQLGRVEPEDVALGLLIELRIAPPLADPVRDLEAPQRLDLPLRAPVPERVRAEDDVLGALEHQQLSQDVR